MSYSNCCGHNDCRPCVEYIPCFGPTGPVGPTATNQFLSLGAGVGADTLPIEQTPINFTTTNAKNGTDISAVVPTSTITLAPNHSYYISYNINVTAVAAVFTDTLSCVLVLNGTPIDSSAANSTTSGDAYVSVAGGTIITVGPTGPLQLQLATTTTSAIFTLANAGISAIELL